MGLDTVRAGEAVEDLSGVVVNRFNSRTLEGEVHSDFNDQGPHAAHRKKVFNVVIKEHEGPHEMMIYFYDLWADKCDFIRPGDKIHISGGADMVHEATGDTDNHLCIVYSPELVDCQIKIKSVNIDNDLREICITSDTLSGINIPMINWRVVEAKLDKKRKRQEIKRVKEGAFRSFGTSEGGTAGSVVYTPLSSLSPFIDTPEMINIYGVIHSYHHPKPCRGTHDFSVTCSLVSPDTSNGPVAVVLFANDIQAFPHIKCVGDIIRLQRVKVQRYQDRPQVLGWHNRSSYILFHRRTEPFSGLPAPVEEGTQELEAEWDVMASGASYTFDTNSELSHLRNLWKWGAWFFSPHSYTSSPPAGGATAEPSNEIKLSTLREMREVSVAADSAACNDGHKQTGFVPVDLDGVVLLLGVLYPGTAFPIYLIVWDGSCQGNLLGQGSQRVESNDIELDSATFAEVESVISHCQNYCDSFGRNPSVDEQSILEFLRSAVSTGSSSSRVVCGGYGVVYVPRTAELAVVSAARALVPGTWVRMKRFLSGSANAVPVNGSPRLSGNDYVSNGIPVQTVANKICATATMSSAFNILPPYHRDVMGVMRSYDQFIKTCQAASNMPRPLPRRLRSSTGESYTPLALCLATPAPNKFLALAKITSFHPDSVDKFVVDVGTGLPPVNETESFESTTPISRSKLVYMFSLRIEDDTASADAIVYGKQGEVLFNGITADAFYQDLRLRQQLKQYLDKVTREGPVFEMNLVTYISQGHIAGEEDPRSSLKRIAIINSTILPL